MTVEVRLTAVAGEYMETAVVQRWLAREGQQVAAGDPLLVVETAKASVEVPAPSGGVLCEIRVAAGSEAPVGAVLGLIAADGERQHAAEPATPHAAGRPEAPAGPAARQESRPFVRATPRARAVARELGVALQTVADITGRTVVTEADVRAAAQRRAMAPGGPDGVTVPHAVERLTGYRRAAAEHVTQALSVPQFSVSAAVDVSALDELRANLRRSAGAGRPVPGVTECVVRAAALALRRVQRANAQWRAGEILLFEDVNIGVAVATDRGLVVPVVEHADRRSLWDLAAVLERLRARADAFELTPEELRGGTFTVSNLGMLGVERFTALVNPPQAAILAVSAAETRVVWRNGAPAPSRRADLTVTADHRVLDGADAARFLGAVKSALERPCEALTS